MNENEIPLDIDHAKHSVGGLSGHFFRRFTHVIMAVIPVIYSATIVESIASVPID